MKKQAILFLLMYFTVSISWANTNSMQDKTSQYFEAIKNDPEQLSLFLQDMPKGGDLHNHLGGASMAEHLIDYAHKDHLCFNRSEWSVSQGLCPTEDYLEVNSKDPKTYNGIVDAWSMRNFMPGKQSGHDHFFATFEKFGAISNTHNPEILAEVSERAGKQNEIYLELMTTTDNNESGQLGKQVGWDPNLATLRSKLFATGLNKIIDNIPAKVDQDEKTRQQLLACGTSSAKAGCRVKIRYLYQVLREQPPEQVFAQLLTGFAIASKDPRFVGINMVQPEDGIISMRDYNLHMKMVGYLHALYPAVHISLHAGELTKGLVPPDGLKFHIDQAVKTAHAERIGHGVDIAYEDHAKQLLQLMARNKIMVEINLESNNAILGVKGNKHPLPLYLRYHVPVALSTDDEGVLRTDLTEQFKVAIANYHLTYPTLKMLVRNSIHYSFLPGKSLWSDGDYKQITSVCEKDTLRSKQLSASCQAFLNKNEKANMQWLLEKQFTEFENSLLKD